MRRGEKGFIRALPAIIAALCLGLFPVKAAEHGDSSSAGPKHRVSTGEKRGDNASKKRSSKSSAHSQTKHRSSKTASRAHKSKSTKAKARGKRQDIPDESAITAIADEANNSVELPQHEPEDVNEIEHEQEIQDASANLMGTEEQNEDQNDSD